MRKIPPSELIINPDGSVFHLHLKPDQISNKIILVGDPARVDLIAKYFDNIEVNVSSREFHTVTGYYKGKRLSVVSHGIGTDNIDIVLTELDALVNIDFNTREIKKELTSLELVRVGTSGGIQTDIPMGSFVVSQTSIGFDGVLNFYANRDSVCNLDFEKKFVDFVDYPKQAAAPYVVRANPELVDRIAQSDMILGITISANGFYGPQGREVRLPLAKPELNHKIEKFEYIGNKVTNYEMESSALAGLSLLMGHKAMTVCAIIANRVVKESNSDYSSYIVKLVETVLERI
ncbi:MAG: nucleoside phosphorylase [Bacteroidales bacterium]|nr:nucleoside phosphorylase [Bacteroidales bacterium]